MTANGQADTLMKLVAYSSDESDTESGRENQADTSVLKGSNDVKIESAEDKNGEKFTTYSELSTVVMTEDGSEYPPTIKDEQLRDGGEDRFSVTDSDSDSSWSSSESDTELKEKILSQIQRNTNNNKSNDNRFCRKSGPMVRGELSVYDLPPVEELNIKLSDDTVICEIGNISSIIDCLVNVSGNATTSPVNDGTVLFKHDRTPIGRVFETFGPVKTPYYLIRFNSQEHIKQTDIKRGDTVFYAPAICDEDITNYVFVDQLKKLKVTDASWKDDTERPQQFQDYSDDEEERKARSLHKARNRPTPTSEDNSKTSPTGKQPRIDNSKQNKKAKGRGQRRAEPEAPSIMSLIDGNFSEVPPLIGSSDNNVRPLMGSSVRPLMGRARPPVFGPPSVRGPEPGWNRPHQNYMPLHQPMNNQLIHRPRLNFQPHPQFQPRPPFGSRPQPLMQTNCQSWPGSTGPPVRLPPANVNNSNWFEGQANTWTDKDSQYYREDDCESDQSFTDRRFMQQ